MSIRQQRLSVTTNASGAATTTGTSISGRLVAIAYAIGTLAAGVDVTVSIVNSNFAATLLTLTNANASANYYPRVQACDNVGAGIAGVYKEVVVIGQPRVVIAQGGDTLSGSIDIVWDDGG